MPTGLAKNVTPGKYHLFSISFLRTSAIIVYDTLNRDKGSPRNHVANDICNALNGVGGGEHVL